MQAQRGGRQRECLCAGRERSRERREAGYYQLDIIWIIEGRAFCGERNARIKKRLQLPLTRRLLLRDQ
jgi:hypothetical protein